MAIDTIDKAMYSLSQSESSFTAEIGNRWYNGRMAESVQSKSILATRFNIPLAIVAGKAQSSIQKIGYQIDVFATTQQECTDISNIFRQLFLGWEGSFGTINISTIILVDHPQQTWEEAFELNRQFFTIHVFFSEQ